MMRLIKRALAPFGLEPTTAAQRANAALADLPAAAAPSSTASRHSP